MSELRTPGTVDSPLVELTWDTNHFGFPVARLALAGDDPTAVRHGLELARQRGVRLVYWAVPPETHVPPALLADFCGQLVDRKATYRIEFIGQAACEPNLPGVTVLEYPPGPASAALRELAVAAGAYSRFRADPRIPEEKFVALYTTWIERCARRELAGVVLVACKEGSQALLGMVTAAAEGHSANVGLIAVAPEARGRGVGRLLMEKAHRWMLGRGARRAAVVTQRANEAACRLYERCGYRLDEVSHFYHFWPQEGRRG